MENVRHRARREDELQGVGQILHTLLPRRVEEKKEKCQTHEGH